MKEWLAQSVETRAYPFVVATYTEKVGWADAGAPSEMAVLLDESTASHGFIRRVSRKSGWDEGKARLAFIAEMQPNNDSVKKGKFGEVLHRAVLEQFCGMVVVCSRYRHNPSPDMSPPGLDIIALMPRDTSGVERVVFAETKLRTSADRGALAKALGQLVKARSASMQPSLKSTLQILSDANSPLFDRVMKAVDGRAPKPHYRIGAIFETGHWSDSLLLQLGANRNARRIDLAVDVIKIGALGCLIGDSYAKAGRSDA